MINGAGEAVAAGSAEQIAVLCEHSASAIGCEERWNGLAIAIGTIANLNLMCDNYADFGLLVTRTFAHLTELKPETVGDAVARIRSEVDAINTSITEG